VNELIQEIQMMNSKIKDKMQVHKSLKINENNMDENISNVFMSINLMT